MSLTIGGWIHSFAVTETNTHKKGYTVYKITSIVFPRAIPKALTCISIWKRFHDVKRLYRELKKRYKSVNGTGQIPELKGENFFKRFDPEIISGRKEYILQLLDFAAKHPALYKSHAFLQFFENGHTPNNSPLHTTKKLVGGNIETICDNLDLTFEDSINLIDTRKDVEHIPIQSNNSEDKNLTENKKPNESLLQFNESVVQVDVELKKEKIISLPPMVSFEFEDMDYIYEAALEFSHAVRAEVNLEFKDAYEKYKNGVEKLLMGSKNDTNDERKFIAKAKIAKYMTRADEIYDKYILHSDHEKKLSFQLSIDMNNSNSEKIEEVYLERPWNQLSRFKVMKVIDSSVLQVQDVTDKLIYIIKGIEKPSCNSRGMSIFLPQNVPYMVELIGFFQSNDKIFLLLKKAKGGKLFDYIRTYTPTVLDRPTALNEIFTEMNEIKTKIEINDKENILLDNLDQENDDRIENKENSRYNQDNNKQFDANIPLFDNLSIDMNVNDLVDCSQKLLQSVTKTLDKFKENDKEKSKTICFEISKKTDEKQNIQNVDNIVKTQKTQLNASPKISNLIKKSKINLPETSIKQWSRELITSIECLHNKGVILGDLHTDNLLLGSKGQLLLSYFYQNEGGNPDSHLFYNPFVNETLCIAPERPLTMKSDWWSLGIVLFELITGHSYQSCHPGGLYAYFEIQFPAEVKISQESKDLLEGLLQLEPENRLNLDDIKCHKFFNDTLWEEISKNGINSM